MSNIKELKKYQIKIDGLKNSIDINFDYFVPLNDEEKRIFVMASKLLSEDLPAHRKKATEDFILSYRADYAMTKMVSCLRGVWNVYSNRLNKGEKNA